MSYIVFDSMAVLLGLGTLTHVSLAQQSGFVRGPVQKPCLPLGGRTASIFHDKAFSGASCRILFLLPLTSVGCLVVTNATRSIFLVLARCQEENLHLEKCPHVSDK